jgi:DNA polymerase III alpha subunit
MKIDEYGQVILTTDDVLQGLYSGKLTDLADLVLSDSNEIQKFQNAVKKNYNKFHTASIYQKPNIDVKQFDAEMQENWFMPEDYYPNLVEMLYGLCETDQQKDRVNEELELFIQHGMLDLLFYLKYLVDTMRSNNIVWGVGRGSSVASYVLYLLGVHKVDSIKYGLDIREFLK